MAKATLEKRTRFLLVVAIFMSEASAQTAVTWQHQTIDDPLHAKTIDTFTLQGKYLTPPRAVTTGQIPVLVIRCVKGKVEQNYFNFYAVLATRAGSIYPVMMEARIDGKSTSIEADGVSTDGTSAYFPRYELKKVLRAHVVIVGANEYLGPEIEAQFDIPDTKAVFAACGSDRMLK
jgi:hypothetical protein